MRKQVAKICRVVAVVFLSVSAPFYLLIVPMMAAKGGIEEGWQGLAFGTFMLAQVFLAVFLYTWEAMSPIYGLPRTFVSRYTARRGKFKDMARPKRSGTCILVGIAYPMFIYAFAVLYVFVSHLSPNSFSTKSELSGFDAFYFSLVAATTVGFGDISPTSVWSKSIVMLQIFLSLLYAVLVFGAISSFLQFQQKSED